METIKIKKPLLLQTKSAEIILGSNEDLLTEILLRLPVKSLIDFKLVSKQWHSIITNPTFCHLRSCPKTDPAIGLLWHDDESLNYVPFSKLGLREAPQILKDFSGITILQSCNGLLLCQELMPNPPCLLCQELMPKPPCSDLKYFVCNPTTKQFSFIPEELEARNRPFRQMTLAFDPTKSPHYHVVCVHQWVSSNILLSGEIWFQIQIYSSETRSWNICGEPGLELLDFYDQVYWKGAIHWLNLRTREHMYFEIDHHVLHRIPMSPVIRYSRAYLEKSRGHLHLIATRSCLPSFKVYEMKSDYSKWFVKYKVDLSPVVASYPEMIQYNKNINRKYYNFEVLSLVRYEEGDEKEPFLVLHIPGEVLRYNLVSMTFEELPALMGDKGENVREKFIRGTRGFLYMESLSCV